MELQRARLVLRSEDGRWALARDLGEVRLYDLFRARPFALPPPRAAGYRVFVGSSRLQALLSDVERAMEAIMDLPLADLYREPDGQLGSSDRGEAPPPQ